MGEYNGNPFTKAGFDFELVTKDIKDIIEELSYKNEEDALLCESIIKGIEKNAAKFIENNKVAQIPLIGCIRKSLFRKAIVEKSEVLRAVRKNSTYEEYKEYVREVAIDIKKQLSTDKAKKQMMNSIKRKNKKKYDELCKTLGLAYANMYLYSRTLFKEIPFDADVQDMFDNIK